MECRRSEPKYLIDDVCLCGASGWNIDSRGGKVTTFNYQYLFIENSSNKIGNVLKRTFYEVNSGTAVLEFAFEVSEVCEGYEFVLQGKSGSLFTLTEKGGHLVMMCGEHLFGGAITVAPRNIYRVKVIINYEASSIILCINGEETAKIELQQPLKEISEFVVKTPAVSEWHMKLYYVRLFQNYLVNEKFLSAAVGHIPYGFRKKNGNGEVYVFNAGGASFPEGHSLKIKGTNTAVIADFASPAECFCFEMEFLIAKYSEGIQIGLEDNDGKRIVLSTHNGQLYFNDTECSECMNGFWYHLRIEVDSGSKTACLKLNGKEKRTLNGIAGLRQVSGICFESGECDSEVWISDVIVFALDNDLSSYVPVPKPLRTNDYHIGIQSCSLWRNGYHHGWDKIEPYQERKPYLGWYDEGNPVVSDWEIKWLCEHGIEFQMFCWFAPKGWREGAIRKPKLAEALHHGYFNARYKKNLKFSIMWENNASSANEKGFREDMVPYWMEYYFKDKQYMLIDNKPFISIYSLNGLLRDFGTLDNVKAQLNYLREACVAAGFSGAYIAVSCSQRLKSSFEKLKACGIDVVFAYSWGYDTDIELQKTAMQTQRDFKIMDIVPTVTVGYNTEPWLGKTKGSYLRPDELRNLSKWVKDDFLNECSSDSAASKMIIYDNWNEFAEGHYIMPSNLYGFGYLDAIRETFFGESDHHDAVPNKEELMALGSLYPTDRHVLKTINSGPCQTETTVLKGWYFDNAEDISVWEAENIRDFSLKNGALCGIVNSEKSFLVLTEELNTAFSEITFLKVTMRSSDSNNDTFKMYFSTEEDNEWKPEKCIVGFAYHLQIESYICPFWDNDYSLGTLKKLKFSPVQEYGRFEIKSIELLTQTGKRPRLFINGEEFRINLNVRNDCGQILLPISGLLLEKLNIYMEYDEETESVLLKDEKNIVKLNLKENLADINDVKVPECGGKIIDRRLYAPLVYILEQCDYDIKYDEAKQIIYINKTKF